MRDLFEEFTRNDGKKLVEYYKNIQDYDNYDNIEDEESLNDESDLHSWQIYSPRQEDEE